MADILIAPRQSTVVRRRFTVHDYYAMAEAGILHEDDRVELIEGEIIEMSPINAPHASHVKRLNQLFMSRLGARVTLGVQDPVRLSEYSEPQPDLALLQPRDDFYQRSHPTPDDVFLLIEVSDSTVEYDRQVKAPLYARSGVREMWLINLGAGQVEVYRNPSPDGYREQRYLQRGEAVAPLAFPEASFRVDEILG